jgi:hypothetical protein
LAVTFWLFGAAILAVLEGLFVDLGVARPAGTLGMRRALSFLAVNEGSHGRTFPQYGTGVKSAMQPSSEIMAARRP